MSEETGAISLAHDGNLYYDLDSDELNRTLKVLLTVKEGSDELAQEVTLED